VAWLVRQGKKGHWPEERPIALVEPGDALLPAGAQGVVLGDGAGDGPELQHTRAEAGWSSVGRTAMSPTATWEDTPLRLDSLGACVKPGTLLALQEGLLTGDASGPLMVRCCWAKGDQEPRSLISHMASAEAAWRLSGKRFRIATFCADQKSRGVHLHTSPLAEPLRLARLFMAACCASIWGVYLGALGVQDGGGTVLHRGDRGDRSLFQLGLRLLDSVLNAGVTIPVAFSSAM
jgi:hypothetical protein